VSSYKKPCYRPAIRDRYELYPDFCAQDASLLSARFFMGEIAFSFWVSSDMFAPDSYMKSEGFGYLP